MDDNASYQSYDATHNPASNGYNGPYRILCVLSTHHQDYSLRFRKESTTQKPWRRDTSAHAATKRSAPRASANTTTGILRRISTARKALRLNSPSDRLQRPTGNTAVPHQQNQSHHGCSQSIAMTTPPQSLRMRQRHITMSLMSMPSTKQPPYALSLRYVQLTNNQQSPARC
jgi:hypothetical protein